MQSGDLESRLPLVGINVLKYHGSLTVVKTIEQNRSDKHCVRFLNYKEQKDAKIRSETKAPKKANIEQIDFKHLKGKKYPLLSLENETILLTLLSHEPTPSETPSPSLWKPVLDELKEHGLKGLDLRTVRKRWKETLWDTYNRSYISEGNKEG